MEYCVRPGAVKQWATPSVALRWSHFSSALHLRSRPGPKDDTVDKELRARAVQFLKGRHEKNGTWENPWLGDVAGLKGGSTALVALALAAKHDKPADQYPALTKALTLLVDGNLSGGGKDTGYLLFTHAELGRALGGTEFKSGKRARA